MRWEFRGSDCGGPAAILRDGWVVLALSATADEGNATAVVEHLNLADEADEADADLSRAMGRIRSAQAVVDEIEDEGLRERIMRALHGSD